MKNARVKHIASIQDGEACRNAGLRVLIFDDYAIVECTREQFAEAIANEHNRKQQT